MNRNLTMSLLIGAIAALIFTSCNKDRELDHTHVTPVTNLFFPEDNAFVQLAQGNITFEWEQARAEDNGLVMYEVLFDRENGDFSAPIYSAPSDGNGIQRRLTLSHGEVNRIAALAGIASQQSGRLKWSVVSSKGINVQPPVISYLLSVERPRGFADLPSQLFLTGSGTEGGEDISQALAFKQTGNGEFEIYTRLTAGAYRFVAARNEDANSFSLDDGGIIQEDIAANNDEAKVVRIRLNFNDASAEVNEIVELGLWFAPDDHFLFGLPYIGNGSWEATGQAIVFKQESWGRDERYKFRFRVGQEDGNVTDEWYGSVNTDNNRPTPGSAPSYWFMVPVNNSRWDNCFKFHDEVDNSHADVRVIFNAEVAAYTHTVTVN